MAGLAAQIIAQRLRLPGLVLLLATGVLLGPDVANVVRPDLMGEGLNILVGFAVAVILFEGGLALDIPRLRREARPIQQLLIAGPVVMTGGGALAAWLVLGWDWRLSVLFGTLVIVTGPTVVTPLLRRLAVRHKLAAILEAEGVFIDGLGAIIAVVALEVALRPPSTENLAEGVLQVILRLGAGTGLGVLGGLAISGPLRVRGLVPERLENIYTLGMVLLLFQGCNAVLHESGIAAVIAAGLTLRATHTRELRALLEFKEQLTVLMIGMLFVLLAADVRLSDVTDLGLGGLVVVVVMIGVLRPLTVFLGTLGTKLTVKERVFLGWIGPRGIVAAAVASLFVAELEHEGIEGARPLRALAFLVITATVLWSGLTGGPAASWLGLRRRTDTGWVLLGTNALARTLATLIQGGSDEVVCIESNPNRVADAQAAGLKVIYGNGLESRTLKRAAIETRTGAIGLTSNENTNLLFLQAVKREAAHPRLLGALESLRSGVTAPMIAEVGGEVLFGDARDVLRWSTRLESGEAEVAWWRREADDDDDDLPQRDGNATCIALAVQQGDRRVPIGSDDAVPPGTRVAFLVDNRRRETAEAALRGLGYEPVDDPTPADA